MTPPRAIDPDDFLDQLYGLVRGAPGQANAGRRSDPHVSSQGRTQTRLAVTPKEAAAMLSVSIDFFNDHIRPELRLIYVGRKVLVPIGSLVDWVGSHARGHE